MIRLRGRNCSFKHLFNEHELNSQNRNHGIEQSVPGATISDPCDWGIGEAA
jgi:hypothetical protein